LMDNDERRRRGTQPLSATSQSAFAIFDRHQLVRFAENATFPLDIRHLIV
jgi:hypothetical protein